MQCNVMQCNGMECDIEAGGTQLLRAPCPFRRELSFSSERLAWGLCGVSSRSRWGNAGAKPNSLRARPSRGVKPSGDLACVRARSRGRQPKQCPARGGRSRGISNDVVSACARSVAPRSSFVRARVAPRASFVRLLAYRVLGLHITLHYITLHCIILHYICYTLHCIAFYSAARVPRARARADAAAALRAARRHARRAAGEHPVAHTAVSPSRTRRSHHRRASGGPLAIVVVVLHRFRRAAAVARCSDVVPDRRRCVYHRTVASRVRVRSAAPAAATTTHFLVAPQPAFDVAL